MGGRSSPSVVTPRSAAGKINKQTSMESKNSNLLSAKLLYAKLTQPGVVDGIPAHGGGVKLDDL